MSSKGASSLSLVSEHSLLRERCDALGLPTVLLDGEGKLVADAREADVVDQWTTCSFMRRLLESTSRRWADEREPQPYEIFPGMWAAPLPQINRRRRVGYLVALYLTPEALDAEQFQTACQSARLDTETARRALRGIAWNPPEAAAATARMLRWTNEDQRTLGNNAQAVAGFSKQLADSYEEISLLYDLGGAMDQLVRPENFVEKACAELRETIPYRWIGGLFVNELPEGLRIGGRFIHVGLCDDQDRAAWRKRVLAELETLTVDSPRFLQAERPEEGDTLVHPVALDGKLVGAIVAGDKQGEDQEVSSVDIKLVSAAASFLGVLLNNAQLLDDKQAMFIGLVKAMTASIDAKDRYTRGHSERVATMAVNLARAMGLSPEDVETIHIAGLVHDVGKIGVPERVLRKPGRLTDDEFEAIKKHPQIGYNILKDIPQLADVLPGVLHHHERWDGRGYPARIAAEEIPLMARILALADSFDAMSSSRTYRPAMPREKVLAEIERCGGSQFDPELAKLFIDLDFSEFDALVEHHRLQDDEAFTQAEEAA